MPAVAKVKPKKAAGKPAFAKLTLEHLDIADRYIGAGFTQKQATKDRDCAKEQLLEALGTFTAGVLPDGRIVSKVSTDFPETTIARKAYTSTALYVS